MHTRIEFRKEGVYVNAVPDSKLATRDTVYIANPEVSEIVSFTLEEFYQELIKRIDFKGHVWK